MGNVCFNDRRGYGGSHRDGVEHHYSCVDYIYMMAFLVGQGAALTRVKA